MTRTTGSASIFNSSRPPSQDMRGKVKLRTYSQNPWGPENVNAVVSSWRLTKEEQDKMWALQRRLSDVDHFKNDPETVLRFMFAPTGYDAAESCFRKMLQWRKENNIDSLLEDYRPPQELIDSAVSTILQGVDRDGDIIYVERGGAMNGGYLLKKYGHEECLKCAIWIRELNTRGAWLDDYEKSQERKIRYVTVVYDLKGLSSNHLNPKVLDLFHDIMKVSHEYYPGPIKRIILIRAPPIFRLIWGVAKHFFRQTARDKMIFAGKDYEHILEKYMDLKVLPSCIIEGGHGVSAPGLPNLIGDHTPNPWWSGNTADRNLGRKIMMNESSFGNSSSYIVPNISLADSDDASLSDISTGSNVSVAGGALAKGHWVDQKDGGSVIFTSLVA